MYVLPRRTLISERRAVHARVVLVGASACGIAALEALAFAPHLRLLSLTLVSPGGLQVHLDDCFASNDTAYMDGLAL